MAAAEVNPLPMDGNKPSSPIDQPTTPGAFPSTNGINGDQEKENEAPHPPPHTSPSSEEPPKPAAPPVDPDAFKAAGNKFFKSKQYDKAVQEYTKGRRSNNLQTSSSTSNFC